MRAMVLSLAVLAALGMAGCSGGSGAQQGSNVAGNGSTAAAPIASSVTGTISLSKPHKLSDKAKLDIELVDVSARGGEPLARKSISPVDAMPVKFTLDVDPQKVKASDLYVVQAELVDGIRHYTMKLQAPVLTQGAPSTANITLEAVPTKGEKILAKYDKLKAHIGGMHMSKGTSLDKTVSRGWQVFRDKESGDIRFVIELADFVDGGYSETNFAYKDNKPWVVVRTKKESEKGKVQEIDRVSWTGAGKVELNEKEADGKTTKLDDEAVAKLRKDAEAVFAKAKKTK